MDVNRGRLPSAVVVISTSAALTPDGEQQSKPEEEESSNIVLFHLHLFSTNTLQREQSSACTHNGQDAG